MAKPVFVNENYLKTLPWVFFFALAMQPRL